MSMKILCLCAALVIVAAVAGCGKPLTQPSPPPPTTSTLTFHIAAAAGNPTDDGNYTAANATFAASVRTTCVPNPSLGTGCFDLAAGVRGADNRFCSMLVFAPTGRTFGVGSYPKAAAVWTADTAGFSFNCARAGTTCNGNVSSFTIHELESNATGVVTRLHMTFEQTCLGGFPPTVGHFGKGTGELWIVDGTMAFP